MHGAGVILVPSRVRTFEIKTIQLNAVWVYGEKFMIIGRENLRVTEFRKSQSSVCNNYLDFPLPPPLVLQTLRSSPSSPGIVVLGRQ